MTNQILVPNLLETINFAGKLFRERLFFNVFSYCVILIFVIMSNILNIYSWGWGIIPWFFIAFILGWILSRVKNKISRKGYFTKKITRWIKYQKSYHKENFVMGMYFCIQHGFPEIESYEDKFFIKHYLVKNYIHFMDLEFILSNIKLLQYLGGPANSEIEFNKIVADYVFEKIQEHEKYREEQNKEHTFGVEMIKKYHTWFSDIALPKEQREFYKKI
ncbi:MAG: hypothetical protein PHZ07_02310 [Patescibacteria group bacterium]|nr:hypothetical protein [Patescibacteria group bacterium]MDD4304234.1 hypothetical protein [Patescibacteria group bacterium]MDD4695288.1 hypothetical protein [Patescibacteria group bacterium]